MRSSFIVFVFFISLALINCQKEVEEETELIPPQKDKNDGPLIPSPNDGRGLIDRITDKISSGFTRLRQRFQEHYQKHIERLQRKAVDAMERLKDYVDNRIVSTTDATAKQYLQSLSEGIGQIQSSLRNLLTSVETNVKETVDKLPKVPEIPEYKVGEQ